MNSRSRFLPSIRLSVAAGTFGLAAAACSAGHEGASASSQAAIAADTAAPAPRDVTGTYTWPTPEGWTLDTIPFPLSYAPELVYQGIEELRFAPSFFDPAAETYWSYSFAFILEDVPALSAAELGRDLTFYYAGLAKAVDPDHFDASAHLARIEDAGPNRYRGVLETTDAFGDGRALRLNLEGETFACGTRRIILASLSPHAQDNIAVWSALEAQKRTFACVDR